MKDPLRARRGAANLGAAGLGRTGKGNWELGVVVAYNSATHTSIVRTHSGRPLQDVPQIKSTATGFDHIPTGTTVVISYDLGIPAIVGCMDFPSPSQPSVQAPTLTGVEGVGDADPTQLTQGTNNFKPPNAPTDMGAGDWAQVGTLGNHVAVLEGGVTLMGSPSAHVQSIGPSGTLRTIARRIQQFSDFGQMRIENDQGRTSFVLRAGSNQATQSGMDEQHWTIRLDLGATGDVLDFRILEPEGKLLFRLHAGSDGRVQIYGDGGVDLSSGDKGTSEMRHDVAGSRTATVGGDETHVVGGSMSSSIGASATTTVSTDETRSVGRNSTAFVGGDRDVGVSGAETQAIAGNRGVQVGGDDTVDVSGSSTSKAGSIYTVDGGTAVKLGANAVEPVIKGTAYGSTVMSPLGAAGAAAETIAATALVTIAPDAFIGSPTALTLTAVTQLAGGLAALGAQLSAIAAAYPGTLSTKVRTE